MPNSVSLNRFAVSVRCLLGADASERRRRRRDVAAAAVEQLEDRCLLSAVTVGADDQESQFSVARHWNEAMLGAMRFDTLRPTIHARHLFHTSAAMYDAWAAYDSGTPGYFFTETHTAGDIQAAREEAISYAAYRVLFHRFANSPGGDVSLPNLTSLMHALGYDPTFTSTVGSSPAAVGNRAAATVIEFGLADGSNEQNDYADTSGYVPYNDPMIVSQSGTTMHDPNYWQALTIYEETQESLTPHWRYVTPFAMKPVEDGGMYHDPGPPPYLGGEGDEQFKHDILRVIRYSSHLDPAQNAIIDVSPAARGNIPLGTDVGPGHTVNPYTGQPYEPHLVNRADWGRVLTEFWAGGPLNETPPGHWNVIGNEVSDRMEELGIPRRIGGSGPEVDRLEWDVKLYFALNASNHDAAIASWDVKVGYDYARPISMVRYMGSLGQSSDPNLPSYHPHGLPLEAGLVEIITTESSSQPTDRHYHLRDHVGQVAIYAWAGHPQEPGQIGGAAWMLPEVWMPYQHDDFVTPPFAGYVSGHSTFSRAAAEVMTRYTGSAYFPGGLGSFVIEANNFLGIETGPTKTFELQWATYYDAGDEAGLSRIYGGIHVLADKLSGAIMGADIGRNAYTKAAELFGLSHDLVIDLPDARGDYGVTIRRNGEDLEIVHNHSGDFQRRALDMTHSIHVNGNALGTDTLVIDFNHGGPFSLPGGITFDGGSRGRDRLILRGTDEADTFDIEGQTASINGLPVSVANVENLRVYAGNGNNTLRLAGATFSGNIDLIGGDGDDLYKLAPSRNARLTLIDSGGRDTLDFSEATRGIRVNLGLDKGQAQRIDANNNWLHLIGTFENVVGTAFSDHIFGNRADNYIYGGGGNDWIHGIAGNNILIGGAGNDWLYGGRGNDILIAGPGNNWLFGLMGDNVFIGDPSKDRFFSGLGDSQVYEEIQDDLFSELGQDWSLFEYLIEKDRN
jgi:hypothetical protein